MENISTWENYTVIGYILGGIYFQFVQTFLMTFLYDCKENIYSFII